MKIIYLYSVILIFLGCCKNDNFGEEALIGDWEGEKIIVSGQYEYKNRDKIDSLETAPQYDTCYYSFKESGELSIECSGQVLKRIWFYQSILHQLVIQDTDPIFSNSKSYKVTRSSSNNLTLFRNNVSSNFIVINGDSIKYFTKEWISLSK